MSLCVRISTLSVVYPQSHLHIRRKAFVLKVAQNQHLLFVFVEVISDRRLFFKFWGKINATNIHSEEADGERIGLQCPTLNPDRYLSGSEFLESLAVTPKAASRLRFNSSIVEENVAAMD